MAIDILLFLILDGVGAAVLVQTARSVPPGRLKAGFVAFIVAMLAWLNPLLAIRLPIFDMAYSVPAARAIFAAGILTLMAFAFFLVQFFGRAAELRKIRFLLIQGNLAILLLATGMGHVIEDFAKDQGRIVPHYGLLHIYFIVSWAGTGVYLFALGWATHRGTTDEFLRFQIGRVFAASAVTFTAILITNAVLPRVTGVSEFAHLGPLSTLVVFGGILRLLARGRRLLVVRAVEELLDKDACATEGNLRELRRLVDALDVLFEKEPERMRQDFEFEGAAGALQLRLERDPEDRRAGRMETRILDRKWFEGFFQGLRGLESENVRLRHALMRAEGALGEPSKLPEAGPDPLYGDVEGLVELAPFRERLVPHLREMREVFGAELVAMSAPAYRLMTRLAASATSGRLALFMGEAGSGKAALARALHHARRGGALVEFSCLFEDATDLRRKISEFLNRADKGEAPGMLLRHVDTLSGRAAGILEPLMRLGDGSAYAYMTAGSGFHGVLADWPEAASEGIRRAIAFETVPLRDRPEDIVYALFHRIWRREAPVTHLTADLVNQLQSRAWPGNFREVHAATDDMLIGRPGPVLREGAPAELHAETEVGPLKLGPLEESERRVILRYLRRNRFNKSATKRELGITINTLNAKIVKYAIAVPGRG